jgi:membrane protease YdiL (CAAX protease family)
VAQLPLEEEIVVSARRNRVPRHGPIAVAVVTAVMTSLVGVPSASAAEESPNVATVLGLGSEVALGGPVGLAVVLLGVGGMVVGLVRRRRLALAAARKRS